VAVVKTITNGRAKILAGAIIALYLAVLIHLSSAVPLQDWFNHFARAVVMADLIFRHGTHFGGVFQYRFLPMPYALGDLALSALVAVVGASIAAKLWLVIIFLSLPAALAFYLRVFKAPELSQILALILAAYLSTDFFFALGFVAFRLGIAMTLTCLALAQLLRQRWSPALYAAYCLAMALGYLMHLSAFVFVTAAICASASLRMWLRTSSLRREGILLIPVACVAVWNVGVSHFDTAPIDRPQGHYLWGTAYTKLRGLVMPFWRYERHWDWCLLLVLVLCLGCLVYRPLRARVRLRPEVLEMMVLGVTFLGMYVVMPFNTERVWLVDARMIPMVAVFVICACLLYRPESAAEFRSYALPLVLAAALAVGNLAYLTRHLQKDHEWMSAYRTVVAEIPLRAKVLPVYTRPAGELVAPLLHAASYVVIDRNGDIPYLFSGNIGHPMRYFRYIKRSYSPSETWYQDSDLGPEVWRQIACTYDYLLVMKPFDRKRIRVAATIIAESSSVALFVVEKQACTA